MISHKTCITVIIILILALSTTSPVSATIWTYLQSQPRFSTLVSILSDASIALDASLNDNAAQDITLFAPNNAALSKHNINNMKDPVLVYYHLVDGRLYSSNFSNDMIIAQSGDKLPSSAKFLRINTYNQYPTINGIPIVAVDANQTNGVVHEISGVLYPFPEMNSTIYQTFPAAGSTKFTLSIDPVGQISFSFPTLGADFVAANVASFLDNRLFALNSQYTFFAPNETALSGLTIANISAFLMNHVVPSSVFSAGLKLGANQVTTLLGTKLIITLMPGGGITVGLTGKEAHVIIQDRPTRNGVIHVIDAPLIPQSQLSQNVLQYLVSAGNFNNFLSIISALNLNGTLTNPSSSLTVFAPSDSAFSGINMTAILDLGSVIANYHMLGSQLVSALISNDQVVQTLASTAGDQWLRFNLYSNSIYLDGTAKIVTPDHVTSNGIVHVIDGVLFGLPANANQTIAQALSGSGFQSENAAVGAVSLTNLLNDATFDPTQQYTFLSTQDSDFTAPDLVATSIYSDLATLTSIIQYLIIPSSYYPTYFPNDGSLVNIQTGSGENVTFSRNGTAFTVNSIQADGPFNRRNGLQYVVHGPLFPPSLLGGELIDALTASGNHSTLLMLLGTYYPSDLYLLACRINTQRITWFAPTDDAFSRLGLSPAQVTGLAINGTLRSILANMILVGPYPATSWSNSVELLSLTYAGNSNFLRVTEYQGVSYVNGLAKILDSQVLPSGSVYHSIDSVIMPITSPENHSIADRLNIESSVSTFLSDLPSALKTMLNDSLLNASNQYTVFAPSNAAFQALSSNVTAALAADPGQFQDLLKYHVVVGTKYHVAFATQNISLTTLQGTTLSVSGSKVGSANIIQSDLNTRGGVIHVIDQVLIPPSVAAYIAAYAQSTGTYVAPAPLASTTTSTTTGGSGPNPSSVPSGVAPSPAPKSSNSRVTECSVLVPLFVALLAMFRF